MTTVHVVIAIWCGVFDHAKAFNDNESAKTYRDKLKKATPSQQKFDFNVVSVEVE